MTENEKIKQAFRLTEAIVGGYSSHELVRPTGLQMDAWRKLFKNCYEGVNAVLEEKEKIDELVDAEAGETQVQQEEPMTEEERHSVI